MVNSSAVEFNSFADLGQELALSVLRSSQLEFLKGRWWLNQKKCRLAYDEFLDSFKFAELSFQPDDFPKFQSLNAEDFDDAIAQCQQHSDSLIRKISALPVGDRKLICHSLLNAMTAMFEFENWLFESKPSGDYLDFSLYRSFDLLDQIIGIDYQLEQTICFQDTEERIYAGAGVGVQSSYAMFLTTLSKLQLKGGSKVVDLGSGYGRFGFVIGLAYPELHFTGFEFVKERVIQANEISKNFGLNKMVNFIEQDLSTEAFEIPQADLYYMYDPFLDTTYKSLFKKLDILAQSQKIQIATKGNANHWIQNRYRDHSWHLVAQFHYGNLCIYSNQ